MVMIDIVQLRYKKIAFSEFKNNFTKKTKKILVIECQLKMLEGKQ